MLKNMSNSKKNRVIHSTAGAYFLFKKEYGKNFSDNKHKNYNNFIEICMYVIEAHHGLAPWLCFCLIFAIRLWGWSGAVIFWPEIF